MHQRPLPTNPNCVSFTADAAPLFSTRSWGELQEIAARIALSFFRLCRLPVLAGYSWRVAMDRKNEQQLQGQLYFVFDGPATSEHLDALEGAVLVADLGFGPATVERVPLTGAPAALAVDGHCYAPWSLEPVDAGGGEEPQPAAEPWARQLGWSDGRVRPRVLYRSQAGPTDQAGHLEAVIGVAPPYTEAEQNAERMRLAFARRVVEQILSAASPLNAEKHQFLDHLFPVDLLVRLGLANAEVVNEYYDAAREVLPFTLGHHDKLALVGVFFSTCCREGTLDAREMRALREGGEMLGLTRDQVVKYLRRFW